MPRGDKSSSSETLAKRAATFAKRNQTRAENEARIALSKNTKDPMDVQAKQAWLFARGINLADTVMRPMDRRKWAYRATVATRPMPKDDTL